MLNREYFERESFYQRTNSLDAKRSITLDSTSDGGFIAFYSRYDALLDLVFVRPYTTQSHTLSELI